MPLTQQQLETHLWKAADIFPGRIDSGDSLWALPLSMNATPLVAGALNWPLMDSPVLAHLPGKAREIHFSTLEAICDSTNCQPADFLELETDSGAAGTSHVA